MVRLSSLLKCLMSKSKKKITNNEFCAQGEERECNTIFLYQGFRSEYLPLSASRYNLNKSFT